jgi:hypothetical protein
MELTDYMLSTAASMQMLTDELDRISIHSSSGLHSPSRESLQSSSKYDSAFDSHYSEDAASLNSQVVNVSYPIDVETGLLPSVIAPPLAFQVAVAGEETDNPGRRKPASAAPITRHKTQLKSPRLVGASSSPSLSPLATHQLGGVQIPPPHELVGHQLVRKDQSPPSTIVMHQHTGEGTCSHSKDTPHDLHQLSGTYSSAEKFSEPRIVSHLMSNTTLPTLHKPQCVYVEDKVTEEQEMPVRTSSETTPKGRQMHDDDITPTKLSEEPEVPHLQRRPSESSDTDDLISNDSMPTPTAERWQQQSQNDAQGLTPRVTIIYPNHTTDSDYSGDSPLISPRHNYFPKAGTVFYQERLTPKASPLHAARKQKSSPHILPNRYRESPHKPQPDNRSVKRSGSILQRLIRKNGSFKDNRVLKRKIPIKRSLSDRMAYNIKKGWVDYEEDLDFISQPTHPRAVGRMIDKKAGKYHMVQLYKPPNGRYGVYISQRGKKGGVFISRFANSTAAKFYSGLISPGDQIIRVNGKNIKQHSVDDVYDLMTVADSVIFTVIPVSAKSDW